MRFLKVSVMLATSALSALIASMVSAEPTDVFITGAYASADADYNINGTPYDGDIDLFSVSTRFYLNDSFYATVTSTNGDGTISNVAFDTTGLSIGGGAVLLGRVDFIAGSGEELRLGLNYTDTEVDIGSTTTDGTSTDLNVGYTAGLGNGLSTSVSYSTDTDSIIDSYSLSAGLNKSLNDTWLIGVAYQVGESELSGGDSAEITGISVGVSYAF